MTTTTRGNGLGLRVGLWAAAVTLCIGATSALAAVQYVEMYGTDSGACGPIGSPCRTISKVIANASAGDKVLVGPGMYGDLDGDGVLGSVAGEETGSLGFGCQSVITIDKQLSIFSRLGPAATVIKYSVNNPMCLVRIEASNTLFGSKKGGFSLVGAAGATNLTGIYVVTALSGVQVVGNSLYNAGAVSFTGPGTGHRAVLNEVIGDFSTAPSGITVSGGDNIVLARNRVTGVSSAFSVAGTTNATLFKNEAVAFTSSGFVIGAGATGSRVVGNTASGAPFGSHGFDLDVSGGGNLYIANTAAATGTGFDIEGTGSTDALIGCKIAGNPQGGIYCSGSAAVSVINSNIIGNDIFANCGLRNNCPGTNIVATNNFWGAPTGPGADPADDVCNPGAGSSTTTAPFAMVPFK